MARAITPCRKQHFGLSLVELMIGLALGLFVVAVALALLAGQLRDTRAQMLEQRLLQDLRTTADLISRDLRRAGAWGHAAAGVWQPGDASLPAANPYAASSPITGQAIAIGYSAGGAEDDVVDANEQFGYRLRAGAIELQLGSGNWQALTDPATMTVTGFDVAAAVEDLALGGSCAAVCPPARVDCRPRQRVQRVSFAITARSANDPRVVRSLRSRVRLRNDVMLGTCPAVPG